MCLRLKPCDGLGCIVTYASMPLRNASHWLCCQLNSTREGIQISLSAGVYEGGFCLVVGMVQGTDPALKSLGLIEEEEEQSCEADADRAHPSARHPCKYVL